MVNFWKDKNKKQLDPELFDSTAEELAKSICKVYLQNRKRINAPTQIRKFYDEVVRFNGRLKSNPEEFDTLLPHIKMMNAKAAYAMGRDRISEEFKNFISESLKQIKDKDDFNAFAGLFEAFMGYYKFHTEKEEKSTQGGAR